MGVKGKIKKAVDFLLRDRRVVKVEISQINYGGILKNRNIVITGGSGGLGLAMARKFVQEGAVVLIVGRNEQKLQQAVKELGANSSYIVFDVTQVEKAQAFIAEADAKLGGIDTLVCNAGLSLHEGTIDHVTIEGYDRQMDVNLKANYFLCQAMLQNFLKLNVQKADLLFISSLTANQAYDLPYGMAKAALNSMVQRLNHRYYTKGIRCNAIAPGIFPTEMTKSYVDVSDGNMFSVEPCGRYFHPVEIAEVAAFLLSDAARIIAGEVITCDGGNTQRPIWK